MTPASFRSWRVRLYGERGQTAAAKALGCSKTTVAAYESGFAKRMRNGKIEHFYIKIPEHIALACAALSHGLGA